VLAKFIGISLVFAFMDVLAGDKKYVKIIENGFNRETKLLKGIRSYFKEK